MKKVSLLILSVFLAFFLCGCAKKDMTEIELLKGKDEIVIGVKTDSRPFGFIDKNGDNVGFDVDVARELTKRLYPYIGEKPIRFVSVNAKDKIMKLNSGEIDLIIAAMSINQSRKNVVDFSSPYFVATQAIMIKKGTKIKSIKDLNYKKVAVIMGTTSESEIRQLAPNGTLRGCVTYQDALKLLQNNEVDAIYADDAILYGLTTDKRYKILGGRYIKEYYAIAMRKEQGEKELQQRINFALDDMRESKVLLKIQNKWLKNYTK